MCTVSFVPLDDTNFILTSNRDETVKRGLASSPQRLQHNGIDITCPLDPFASGSWIAASGNGRVSCLLNGAFKKHKRQLPYRQSRGIVVLDSLTFPSSEAFASNYNFDNIEPFTIVMVQKNEALALYELRWDGQKSTFRKLDEKEFHLWSSVTLYTDDLIVEKENLFKSQLDQLSEFSLSELMNIHKTHFLYEDWVKPPVRVEEVATLSVTSVQSSASSFTMYYRDLVRKDLPLTTVEIGLGR